MKLKIILLLITFCFTTLYSNAQSLNGYKYILVPKKFDFQNEENKYQLSSLTKFLFNKEGFITLFEGDKTPKELYDNPCLALKTAVQNKSNLFSTKVNIVLRDCRDAEIFVSAEGKSKEKDFKKGFHQSLRKAFESVKALNYAYDSSAAMQQPKVDLTEDDLVIEEVVEESAPNPTQKPKDVNTPVEEVEEVLEETVAPTIVKEVTVLETAAINSGAEVLYAQSKPFGFQLVDSTPKVVYILQKSSTNELYILKNKNGIIHKKNGAWVAEYYENGSLVQQELTIKF